MKYLTLNEEILLLCIWRLGNDAYGVAIRDLYVETTTFMSRRQEIKLFWGQCTILLIIW